MRLIDADELIKRMRKWMPKDPCGREQTVEEVVATDIAASVFMEIEETPTAFDKEKVIEELRQEAMYELGIPEKKFNSDEGEYSSYCSISFSQAKRIVEKGGIE